MKTKQLAKNFKNGVKLGIVRPTSVDLFNYLSGGGYADRFNEVKEITRTCDALLLILGY